MYKALRPCTDATRDSDVLGVRQPDLRDQRRHRIFKLAGAFTDV